MKIGFIAMFVITVATGVYYVVSSLASISSKLLSFSHVIGTGVLLVPLVILNFGKKILGYKYRKKSVSFYYG
jgi:multisubunit Na+/H+ antiporter MnhB subunit